MELQPHPIATIFPLLEGKEFDTLVGSVAANGVFEPIILHEGMILDGRNRYRAAVAAGIECPTKDFDGIDPVAFVVAHNLHRRHLKTSQRALVAAKMANLKHGSNQFISHTNQEDKEDTGIPVSSDAVVSIERAAAIMSINQDTVCDAKIVLAHGTEDEVKMAEDGEAAVSTLAKKIRQRVAPEVRRAKEQESRNSTREIQSEVWKNFRQAMELLSGLPHPSEVAALATRPNMAAIVEQRLPQSLQWLKEFSYAWTNQRNA